MRSQRTPGATVIVVPGSGGVVQGCSRAVITKSQSSRRRMFRRRVVEMTNDTHTSLQAVLKADRAVFPLRPQLPPEPPTPFWPQSPTETTLDSMIARLIQERVNKAP